MMTRDHNGWWWIMGGAITAALLSDLSIINDLAPDGWEKPIHALIKLVSIIVVAGAGVARMSPLQISPEGRVEAMRKKEDTLDKATIAAAKASVKAEKAVEATTEAAESAEAAKDVSKEAAKL